MPGVRSPRPDRAIEPSTDADRTPTMRDPFAADQPQLQDVLDALDDPECRTIVEQLTEPMTARGISTRCGIPLSTTYRKLDLLSDASLVTERTEVGASGRHTAQYIIDFEEVRVALDDDRSLGVAIEHPERTPDERLSDLWSEVQER
jgi:hypothetical protein